MAEERGLTVDTKGFADAMEEARERSRGAQNKVFLISTNSSYQRQSWSYMKLDRRPAFLSSNFMPHALLNL